ncbi:aldehyde dehydrogenase family protein [archaeon]|nr:MAG: aldehyde dehydrogenase family protein [archaeon]
MMLGNLHKWMQPIETPVPALFAPATSYITHEPYGVALVIGAFNYPVVLTLSPMIGAIAAGMECV